jgi:ligand-binding sensor domain-containing protein/signal transduction histidine kinase
LLASFVLADRALALDPNKSVYQYICQNWSQQQGLPANGINCIAQAADGYLWLGASRGLIRFDGVNFDMVGMVATNRLRTTEVLSMVASPDGGLWLGIKKSAYGHYDGHGGWALSKESSDGTVWNVPFMMQSKDGRLWIGGERAWVRSTNGEVQALFPDATTRIVVTSGLEDSHGRIWLGTAQNGLFYMDQGKMVKYGGAPFDSTYLTVLAEDKSGHIWTGGNLDLICFDPGAPPKIQYPGGVISALLADKDGALWVGTFGNGLLRYYNGVWSSLKKTDGLGDDFVVSLAEDREGSLWVGTREGLSQLTDVKLPTLGIKDGLGWETALGVSASPRGGVWVGTPVGAAYFDGQSFTEHCTTNSGLQTVYAKRALETRNGDLYLLSGHNEISILTGGKFLTNHPTAGMPVAMIEDGNGVMISIANDLFRVGRDYVAPYAFTNKIKPEFYWIINLARCKDGSILVACGNGIFKVKDGGYEQWTSADGLSNNEGQWVFEDDDGTIWAGMTTGISRIRGREIRNIRRESGLLDGHIWAMVPDASGNFWVDSNSGIFAVKRQDLNDFADGKISHVNCVAYNEPPAIKPADKYGQEQSACRSLDGRVWFPSSRGLVMVNPTNIPVNTLPPLVHIARLRANGRDTTLTNGIRIPPGRGELEFQYSGLSYIVPQKIRFRYQLEGYDHEFVEADNRRMAVYNNLKPGRYTFHVNAANADGIWSQTGDSLALELLPSFYQTAWFYFLCAVAGLSALGGIYAWRVRHLTRRQIALQKTRDLLETQVASRTAELATANATLQDEEAKLKQRTEALEREIEERKRMQLEIERVHRELLESSRLAGMAEIATNVLHNVGNVLNSVNVSASLVTDSVKKSKASSLAKVVLMFNEHKHDLGTFFTNDPKGKQLPAYLNQLSEQLLADQGTAISELNSLQGNIEHIKEIVTMQQSYARVSGVKEIVNLRDLVEDSLRMNTGSFNRHGLEVIREFADVPPLNIEKHKVLQILVNLVRNAKHACDDSGRTDKRLTVRMASSDDRITISVTDNGVGILPENLTRIFSHGFTTKKNGHGFGLHSGALAAKEMSGSLSVSSDGPGWGATFTLELPCTTNKD